MATGWWLWSGLLKASMGWLKNVCTCHIWEQNLGNQLLTNSILVSIFYVLELFHLNGFYRHRRVLLWECIFLNWHLSIKDLVLRNLSYTACLYRESNRPTYIIDGVLRTYLLVEFYHGGRKLWGPSSMVVLRWILLALACQYLVIPELRSGPFLAGTILIPWQGELVYQHSHFRPLELAWRSPCQIDLALLSLFPSMTPSFFFWLRILS